MIRVAGILVVGLLLLSAGSASAKSGKAWLLTPIYLATAPGDIVHVAWVIRDDDGSSFNAIGVFVRFLSATGHDPTEGFASATAHATGEDDADVIVPAGGIGGIEIGVAGTAGGPGMPAHRSDGLFQIANIEWTRYEIQPVRTPPPDVRSATAAPTAIATKAPVRMAAPVPSGADLLIVAVMAGAAVFIAAVLFARSTWKERLRPGGSIRASAPRGPR